MSNIKMLSKRFFSSMTQLHEKEMLVKRLFLAKKESRLTFDEIASHCGITNAYCAQLLLNQAQLKENTMKKLKECLPSLSEDDLARMQQPPMRSYSDELQKEPLVYRLNEAVLHYGEGIKQIVNEKCGDGIVSAIDFYVQVQKIKGNQGEDRIVVTFNGKYLPFVEQLSNNDTFSNNASQV